MLFANLISKLLNRWPFDRGQLRIFNLLSERTKAGLDQLPQPIRMRSGVQLFVRAGDHLSRWFRCFGTYEPQTSRMLRKHAHPEKIFLDVGANLGLHGLGVAQDVGCPVAAFEPHPETADCLERSIALNKLTDRVRVFRIALSNEDTTGTLVQPLTHAGKSALQGPNPHFREGGRFAVRVAKLDSLEEFQTYLAAQGCAIGLIKMDIEGAEELALRGMERLIREHRPTIIMELYDGNLFGFVSSKAAVISLLESWDYELAQEFEWNGLFLPRSR